MPRRAYLPFCARDAPVVARARAAIDGTPVLYAAGQPLRFNRILCVPSIRESISEHPPDAGQDGEDELGWTDGYLLLLVLHE